ncbi:hypothetical protein K439DRAFT_528578 [Ramaria rubella]|nr:hypothetical protein K439DRAFT_528578 [Ramaria rubella]
MLTHANWSAWVSIDGKEIPQYLMTVSKETQKIAQPPFMQTIHKISCWIASEEGKEFTVNVTSQASHNFQVHASYLYMDGKITGGEIFKINKTKSRCFSGCFSSDGQSEAPFLFSRLELTDDDSAISNASRLQDLGIIRIDTRRVAALHGQASECNFSSLANEPVHEKSKKAGKIADT